MRALPPSALLLLFLLAGRPSPAQESSTSAQTAPATAQDASRTEIDAALDKKDFPRALRLLTVLAAENPKDARILYNLAYVQESLDQNSAAEVSYRAAAVADASWLEPHLALGLLLARTGHSTEARQELLTATQIPSAKPEDKPLQARAFRALARLDQTAHPPDLNAAREDLLAALKLSPESPEDIAMAADLAEHAQDLPEAEQAYRRLLAQTPQDPTASASLAHILLLENKSAEAEPLLRSSLTAHPDDPALTAQLASVYATEGKLPEATGLVEKLRALRPRDADILRLLAHLYTENQDFAHAEPLYASLVLQTPQDPTLVDARADALIHLRRYAEAEPLLQRIVATPAAFPTPADLGSAASHLAFAASENNDPNTVLQAVAVRDTVLPPSASSVFLAAISFDKLRQSKQARESYKQFLTLADGKFPDQEFQARHRLVALEHMR